MIATQSNSGYAWGVTPAKYAYRKAAVLPIQAPQRRPFSKPIAKTQPGAVIALRTVKPNPYPSGPGREAMDGLPPMDPSRMISGPEPSMGDAAIRLFKLLAWFEICLTDRKLDSEVYVTECRIREQAAHIIGFLA